MSGEVVEEGFIKTLLNKPDFPYIITLLLGLIAFGVTSIVDSITSTPAVMVEEEYIQPSNGQNGSYKLVLTNLTSGINFKGLIISIESTNYELLFSDPRIRVLAPGMHPKVILSPDNVGIRLEFSNLLPNVAFEINTKISLDKTVNAASSKSIPHFRIYESSKGMSFYTPGLKTLLIQHEIGILLFLCIVFPLFCIGLWIKVQRSQ